MKKTLISFVSVVVCAGSLFAVPTATVLFKQSANRFYTDAALTTLTTAGWYVEVVLSANNNAYDSGNFGTYLTVPGVQNGITTYHETGKAWDGATLTAGQASIKWQYTDTTYVNYYATFRFYNAADKAKATKYGVLPTWYQITALPSEVIPRPITADQTITWSNPADKSYTKYDVPAVPEPTTMALFGLSGLGLFLRRKLRKEA